MSESGLRLRRIVSGAVLLMALIQVAMFFVGLEVPLHRLEMLWGKSFQERQKIAWQPGWLLTQVAQQFPLESRIYLEDPQTPYFWMHYDTVYYFYPRYVSITMSDRYYGTDQEYASWNEHPSEAWLLTNGFTHVLSYKDGIHIRPVGPSSQTPNATAR